MEQIGDTYLFLPATTQGWLILLVFGTTEDYWNKFKELLAGVFCFGYVCRRFRKRRQRHQFDPSLEQSTDNFIADSESNERGQVQSLVEGEFEIPRPTRVSSTSTSRRQSLLVSQPMSDQPPSNSHKHSTSLIDAFMSKPLPPPPRNAHISRQLGAASPPLSSPLEPWDLRAPGTYTWRIERGS